MDSHFLRTMESYLFDLDGCLYYGKVPAAGAGELLQLLKNECKQIFFVTNNSTDSAKVIADRLNAMGLSARPEQVITATELIGQFIKDTYGEVKVKMAGSESLRIALEQTGHRVLASDEEERADVIVIGRDIHFHYDKLVWIAAEVKRGARVIGTNSDTYHIGSQGEKLPETGTLTTAVEALIGQQVEHVGKPEPYLFQHALKQFNLRRETTVMVGDNMNTDILGGARAGMRTIWVKPEEDSFIRHPDALTIQADLIVNSIQQLLDLYLIDIQIP